MHNAPQFDVNVFLLSCADKSEHHGIRHALSHIINQGNLIMVSVQDIKDTVTAEAAEVKARVDALEARIAELLAAPADGATQAELVEIQEAVKGIFTPAA